MHGGMDGDNVTPSYSERYGIFWWGRRVSTETARARWHTRDRGASKRVDEDD